LPFFPDVPTLSEAGIKGVELGNWFGLFAPAATPAEVVARLGREVAKAVALPDVRQRYAELGVEPVAQNSTALRKTVADKTKLLSALIRDPRIAVD
jgi:tripartite-type tricarboxylate transporter receptor subunit TctC